MTTPPSSSRTKWRAASERGLQQRREAQSENKQDVTDLLAPAFRMKEETRVALKLHVVHEKALLIERRLLELQLVTTACCDLGHSSEARDAFVRKCEDAEREVRTAKKLMIRLCAHKCLEKHYTALMSVLDDMGPRLDISVQFFGMNWRHAFRVAANLVHLVDAMQAMLRDTQDNANHIDFQLVYPSHILRDLATLEADLGAHFEAVTKGRVGRSVAVQSNNEKKNDDTNDIDGDNEDEGSHEHDPKEDKAAPVQRLGVTRRLLRNLQHNFKKRLRRRTSNDDLWRLWYLGVQSMTLVPKDEQMPLPRLQSERQSRRCRRRSSI